MAISTQAKPLERRETSNLIGSDKVEGTPVRRPDGERVGQIERIMIDKLKRQGCLCRYELWRVFGHG